MWANHAGDFPAFFLLLKGTSKMIPETFGLEEEYHLHTIKSLDSSPGSFCWFSSTKNGGFLQSFAIFSSNGGASSLSASKRMDRRRVGGTEGRIPAYLDKPLQKKGRVGRGEVN